MRVPSAGTGTIFQVQDGFSKSLTLNFVIGQTESSTHWYLFPSDRVGIYCNGPFNREYGNYSFIQVLEGSFAFTNPFEEHTAWGFSAKNVDIVEGKKLGCSKHLVNRYL